MKRSIITVIIICIVISVGSFILIRRTWPISDLRGKGTTRLENHSDIVLSIEKNKNCIPVRLTLYSNGLYELFTEYEACKPYQECTKKLHYTKSIKGKYNYDLTKILDNDIEYDENVTDYQQIDYKIISGTAFGSFSILGEKYDHNYVIEKGKTNKCLKEFLQEIDIDLDKCAIPDYN